MLQQWIHVQKVLGSNLAQRYTTLVFVDISSLISRQITQKINVMISHAIKKPFDLK